MRKILQNTNQQVINNKYIFNLGQLLNIVPNFKRFLT